MYETTITNIQLQEQLKVTKNYQKDVTRVLKEVAVLQSQTNAEIVEIAKLPPSTYQRRGGPEVDGSFFPRGEEDVVRVLREAVRLGRRVRQRAEHGAQWSKRGSGPISPE